MINLHTEYLVKEPPPPVEWIIKDVAARGYVTMLYGDKGVGKSLLTLAWASAMTGQDQTISDFECTRTGALLVDAENGQHELARRLGYFNFNGQCGHYFQAIQPESFIDNIGELASLCTYIVQHHAGLVILDSLTSLWPGDQIKPAEVTVFLRELQRVAREYDTAIIFLHHENKYGDYRGTTAMGAVPEIILHMGKWPKDLDQGRRYLMWDKCRLAAEPSRKWIRIVPTFGGVEIEHASKPTKEEMSWDG